MLADVVVVGVVVVVVVAVWFKNCGRTCLKSSIGASGARAPRARGPQMMQ